jgi:uncharacterized protein
MNWNAMVAFQSAVLLLGLVLGLALGFTLGVGRSDFAPNDFTPGDFTPGDFGDPVLDSPLRSVSWWGGGVVMALGSGAILAFAMLGVVFCISRANWGWFRRIEQLLDQILVPSFRGCRVWQLLIIAILAGVGEELLFRWAIQGWLELASRHVLSVAVSTNGWSPNAVAWLAFAIATVLSAVLFGLCHAITRAYWVMATVMGLIFSLLVVSGGGLVGAIVAHGLYDFLAFLWLVVRIEEKSGAGAENEFTGG